MAIIKINNLNKKFDKVVIFNNLNLEIESGKIYAIMGESGSGKSTLLNIIGCLEKYNQGNIELFSKKNVKVNSRNALLILRNKISYLFQNYGLSENDDVYYNLKIALKYSKLKNQKEAIGQALKEVGLKGYEDKKIYTLSGG